jgi:hypothetical protein
MFLRIMGEFVKGGGIEGHSDGGGSILGRRSRYNQDFIARRQTMISPIPPPLTLSRLFRPARGLWHRRTRAAGVPRTGILATHRIRSSGRAPSASTDGSMPPSHRRRKESARAGPDVRFGGWRQPPPGRGPSRPVADPSVLEGQGPVTTLVLPDMSARGRPNIRSPSHAGRRLTGPGGRYESRGCGGLAGSVSIRPKQGKLAASGCHGGGGGVRLIGSYPGIRRRAEAPDIRRGCRMVGSIVSAAHEQGWGVGGADGGWRERTQRNEGGMAQARRRSRNGGEARWRADGARGASSGRLTRERTEMRRGRGAPVPTLPAQRFTASWQPLGSSRVWRRSGGRCLPWESS